MAALNEYIDYYPRAPVQSTVIPVVAYPFANYPFPDVYPRVIKREFDVVPLAYTPTNADRTSYTNKHVHSENFGNAAWTSTNVTVTTGYAANPGDGAVTANRVLETVANAEHAVVSASGIAVTNGQSQTVSVFAKADGRDWIQILATDGSNTFSAFFNLTTATRGTISGVATSAISSVGYGFCRCSITFAAANTGTGGLRIGVSAAGITTSYAGDVTKGVLLFGAQWETASSVGPYISTTTATRTVSAPSVDGIANQSGDIFAYLVEETSPLNRTSAIASIGRTYARIPGAQSMPSWILLPKPGLPFEIEDQVVGAYYVNRPDEDVESYDAYFIQAVTSDTGAVSGFYPTGGTYTLSFDGDTTGGIAYNAAAATVQTALNALTSVTDYGGLTVSGSYNSAAGLIFLWNTYGQATITSSLTSAGPTPAVMAYPDSTTGGQGLHQVIGGYNTTNAVITGGTFTITVLGQTTAAIAYNATTTQVKAALNLLSEVTDRGGVSTVTFPYAGGTAMAEPTGPHFGFTFIFADRPSITGDPASLTPAPAFITDPGTHGAGAQALTFSIASAVRSLYIDGGHGFALTDTLFLKGDGSYFAGIEGNFALPDANTIQFTLTPGDTFASVVAITEIGKRTKSDYRPGTTTLRCTKSTLFYLPGVSPGITTAADIPIPDNESSPAAFLQAAFAGTGTINWQVGEITQWLGPILQQSSTTVAASDL